MTKFSRRDFLKFTSAFLAFIPAIRNLLALETPIEDSKLYPTELQDPTPPPLTDEDLIAEKYESGFAKIITSDHIIIENYKGQVILHISNKTDVWDGIKWVGDLGADVGDEIVGWGIRNPDNSLTCEKLYVNIVNYIGEVSEISTNSRRNDNIVAKFVQNDRFRGRQSISIAPHTMIDDGQSRKLYKERPVLPKNSDIIQVIGRVMKDGTTLAAVVYLSQ
ncbi:MAG: hypothetical protein HUU11_11420 [Anaerolineales bacterium]|nr:hypothetical protein [Anaerolineales bacterium]